MPNPTIPEIEARQVVGARCIEQPRDRVAWTVATGQTLYDLFTQAHRDRATLLALVKKLEQEHAELQYRLKGAHEKIREYIGDRGGA